MGPEKQFYHNNQYPVYGPDYGRNNRQNFIQDQNFGPTRGHMQQNWNSANQSNWQNGPQKNWPRRQSRPQGRNFQQIDNGTRDLHQSLSFKDSDVISQTISCADICQKQDCRSQKFHLSQNCPFSGNARR